MAEAQFPAGNDRQYDLEKKIALNTAIIAGGGGVAETVAIVTNGAVVSTANPLPVTDATVAAEIGATDEAAAATDTSTSGLNGLFKRLLARLTTMMSVAGTYATNVLNIQGAGFQGNATITRAANQNPYTIGDVVGGAFEITTAGPTSGDVLCTSVRVMYNVTALPTGLQNWTLHLYNATPPSAIADNSPFTLAAGDRAAYICHLDNIPLAALGVGTQTVQGQLDNIVQQFRTVGGTSLFGYLVTNQAFTPAANSETITFRMRGILP